MSELEILRVQSEFVRQAQHLLALGLGERRTASYTATAHPSGNEGIGQISAINATAKLAGMNATWMSVYPGCAVNVMTLADVGRLYEGIANATLFSVSSRDALYRAMPAVDTGVWAIVDDEAARLGLSASRVQAYKDALKLHYKQGSMGYNGREWLSDSGLAELPECNGTTPSRAVYVWGLFVHNATFPSGGTAFTRNLVEPLRRPIRNRLAGWAACSW